MIADLCDDCIRCVDCEQVQCLARPYCQHGAICDTCYPSSSCEACIEQLESEGALA